MTPTDVMDRPAWRFWMDSKIRAAGVAWENEQKRAAADDGDAGAATNGEKSELVRDQEARADRREQQDGQPDLSDQLAGLETEDS